MNAGIYIELPANTGSTPRLALRQGSALQPARFDGFRASGRPRAIAFAPALSVRSFRVPIAARSETEARKAALYAIEDELAQPVEDVHIILGPKQRGTPLRDVYVADKALVGHWTETLQAAGLGHAEIVAEISLPLAPGAVFDFGDRLLMHGKDGVTTADRAWPEDVLSNLLRTAGLEDAQVTMADALQTLAGLEAQSPGVRLTDARAAAEAGPGGLFRRWRLAAMLMLAAAAVWTAGLQAEINRIQTAARQQEAEARALYRRQFPAAPEPDDIHAEIRRLSAGAGPAPGAGFLDLSAAVYEALALSPGAELIRLSYTGAGDGLAAGVRFAAPSEAEAFRAALEAKGWQTELESPAGLAPGAEASVRVRAAP